MSTKEDEQSSSSEDESSSSEDSSGVESSNETDPQLSQGSDNNALNPAQTNFDLSDVPNINDYTVGDLNNFVQTDSSLSQVVLFKLPSELSPVDLNGISIKINDDKTRTIEIQRTGQVYSYCRETVPPSRFLATCFEKEESQAHNVSFVKPSYVISFKKQITSTKTPKQRHFISKKSVPAIPKEYRQRLIPFGCINTDKSLANNADLVSESKPKIKNWLSPIPDKKVIEDSLSEKKEKKNKKHKMDTSIEVKVDKDETPLKAKKKKKRKSDISGKELSNGHIVNSDNNGIIKEKKKKSKKLKLI